MTEQIYSTDSYAKTMEASVVRTDVDDNRVLVDRTVFYPGGGGQPHDIGELTIGDDRIPVVRVLAIIMYIVRGVYGRRRRNERGNNSRIV